MADAEQVLKPVSDAKPSKLWWVYEGTMALLALVVVWLLTVPDDGWARAANLTIWAVFVIDYGVRLKVAGDRRHFVRSNIPDLIAILPLDFLRVARLARLARLTRLLRAGTVVWRVTKDVRGVLGTNGLGYVVLATAALVVCGGLTAWVVEEQLGSFGDGLWWALVTATTVGYGDISPVTPQGRAVATVLMLVGIGTLGMITGSIATYFLGRHRAGPTNRQVEWLRAQLAEWDELGPAERRRLAAMLMGLAYDQGGGQIHLPEEERVGASHGEQARYSGDGSSEPRRGAGGRRDESRS
jgi:voltage-gated potassium channel